MRKLVCELCGSNDFTKDDQGLFVCDYCRTKYTPEQAKSMVVEGTVRVDRSGEASSLLSLAGNAVSCGNMREALDYSNRALEIDAESATAWYLKGTAVAQMSTREHLRLREMQQAYALAIHCASDEERASMYQWCGERTTEIAESIAQSSWAYVGHYGHLSAVWDTHLWTCEEIFEALGSAYRWFPSPATLRLYISIACDLIKDTRVKRDHRDLLLERLEWAGSQMRLFDPSYETPRPRRRWI